jgi:hypothetical protein
MRFRLRTLLILLAILPPLLSGSFSAWNAWRTSQRTQCVGGLKQISIAIHNYHALQQLAGQSPSEP